MEEPCEDKYTLKWREFSTTVTSGVESLLEDSDFVDVTLSCEGQTFSVHKVMLAASSRYFRTVLKNNPCQHPIIILRDVKPKVMRSLIEYVYCGVVTISEQDLGELLRIGEMLEIKGLSGDEQIDSSAQKFVETEMDSRKSPDPPSPPRKRKKTTDNSSNSNNSTPTSTNGPLGFLAVNNVRSLRERSSPAGAPPTSDFNDSSNLSVGSPTQSALEPQTVIQKKKGREISPQTPESAFSLVTPKTEPPDDEVEEGGLTAPGPSGISQQAIQESSEDSKSSSFTGIGGTDNDCTDQAVGVKQSRRRRTRTATKEEDCRWKNILYLSSDHFQCKLCCRTFRSKSGCRSHIDCVHFTKGKNEWDKCDYCKMIFPTKQRVQTHMNLVHGILKKSPGISKKSPGISKLSRDTICGMKVKIGKKIDREL